MRILSLLFAVLFWSSSSVAQEVPVLTSTLDVKGGTQLDADKGSTGVLHKLQKLRTTASALHTVAHPDDEHAGMLTYLSRGEGVRTALFSVNRGEAGANAIGAELFDALGLIRTEELRLAGRYYGLDDLYFSGALDYGYSKTLEESYRSWDLDQVLGEMVRIIRTNRPLVVISRFHGSLRDGHGNHQAMGELTPEAVAAAGDPYRYPEQITEEGLRPWVTPKLYRGGIRENEFWHLGLDVGMHSPWLGDTYQNFGAYGLSLQRSQTSGRSRERLGPVMYYYERIDSAVSDSTEESSFFDGLDTSLPGVFSITGETPPEGAIPALEKAQALVESAISDLDISNPSGVLPSLTQGLAALREALALLPDDSEAAFMLAIKEQQFMHAISAALNLSCHAIGVPQGTAEAASPWSPLPVLGPVVRGQAIRVDVSCSDPRKSVTTGLSVSLQSTHNGEAWSSSPSQVQTDPYIKTSFDVQVPDYATFSRPYYFRESVRENHYQYHDHEWIHRPSRPAALEAVVSFTLDGQNIYTSFPVKTREANLPYGYVMRNLQVLPSLAVRATPSQRVIVPSPEGNTFNVSVDVINNHDGEIQGMLLLDLPDGWTSDPAQHSLSFTQAGQRQAYNFQVSLSELGNDELVIRAVATANDTEYAEGYDIVRHPHMETRYLFRPAEMVVTGLDVAMASNLNVGYLMGVGDDVPSGINQLGASVTLLTENDLASAGLSEFDAIVIGTRAYAVRQDLHTYNQRLLDYAYNGGNLIVLYQTQEFVPNDMAPFPAMLPRSAEEVSEEDAPVTILDPEAPLFSEPNQISDADFDGWIEQRGSKFFTEWDTAYTPLIETHDTGQEPQRGVLLTSNYGDGYYTYCALAFHRQLPYGVSGAYRLFANLLSLGSE